MSLRINSFWIWSGAALFLTGILAGIAMSPGGACAQRSSALADVSLSPPGPPSRPTGGSAQDPSELFSRGNRLYEEGRFAEAAMSLQELVDSGFESPALYFNLGNALLKSGELGEAIVYYERARSLDPRAADIRANLAYARSLVVDVMPETESSGFLDTLARLKDSISAGETIWAAAALFWLGAGAIAAARLSRATGRRIARAVALGCFLLLALVGPLAAIKVHEAAGRQRAVLVSPEVAVRAGPGESYSSRFSLHEGTTVTVERQAGSGWAEIQLTPTLSGWVPSGTLMNL